MRPAGYRLSARAERRWRKSAPGRRAFHKAALLPGPSSSEDCYRCAPNGCACATPRSARRAQGRADGNVEAACQLPHLSFWGAQRRRI